MFFFFVTNEAEFIKNLSYGICLDRRKDKIYNEEKQKGERHKVNAALEKLIGKSNRIVFFGGAGVSTESGIPDFRSVDGLYHQHYKYPPEIMLSHTFFMQHPEEFYKFYRDKLIVKDVKPNVAHKRLAQLEQQGKLTAVITQNIDGLHTAAGSQNVLELHGSTLRNYCMKCGKFYPVEAIAETQGIPRCTCGGMIKPDVVLYEEGLNQQILEKSIRALRDADLLIVGGTSLTVYPAAGLLQYYGGKNIVIINKTPTPADNLATLVLNMPIGEALSLE